MKPSIELVLLKCLRCGAHLPAGEEEVAWVCAQCGQGMQLTPDGLAPLTVQWAAARPGVQGASWLPFWVFGGTVHLARRETYGVNLFGGGPDRLWEARRRFYVPAFPAPLEQLETVGADLTRRQIPLNAGPPAGALKDCTLFPDDARQAAEFVVLTIEADRKDKLKTITFTLNLDEPELWVLPFAGEVGARNLVLAD
jgi:hypothetical protein